MYFVLLRDSSGAPLLGWGDDSIAGRPDRVRQAGFRLVVLTCAGCQHPGLHDAQVEYLRGCGFKDRGTNDPDTPSDPGRAWREAQATVLRCAPGIAEGVARGIPTLITCAAGQNRSALMTARVANLVTGESGASLVARIRALRPRTSTDDGAFSNNVFRRWAESWPATSSMTTGGMSAGAKVALVAAAGFFALALGVVILKRK